MLLAGDTPLSTMASRVVLEITERATLDDVPDLERRTRILRQLGFRIAVDDLGAGHAGLATLTRLEPEFVKLDLSLVQQVHLSPVRQKLVASVSALCADLHAELVAEGVEEPADRDRLLALGCRLQQGYLFAKPDRSFLELLWDKAT
jgi:EAL domain-containing protein (putative c-di-GMP-specific phosphodiesterase class I)